MNETSGELELVEICPLECGWRNERDERVPEIYLGDGRTIRDVDPVTAHVAITHQELIGPPGSSELFNVELYARYEPR